MYLEYYSLDRPPFRITPDPSLFLTLAGLIGRGVVLEALLYAVTSGEGILKVVGEVGSGKNHVMAACSKSACLIQWRSFTLRTRIYRPTKILYAIAF